MDIPTQQWTTHAIDLQRNTLRHNLFYGKFSHLLDLKNMILRHAKCFFENNCPNLSDFLFFFLWGIANFLQDVLVRSQNQLINIQPLINNSTFVKYKVFKK